MRLRGGCQRDRDGKLECMEAGKEDRGGMEEVNEKGLVRLEGKEYVVKDGDVILFRFNV